MRKNMSFVYLIFLIALFSGTVFGDTNGIWHYAEDVRGGTFGADEQDVTSFYRFINRVIVDVNESNSSLSVSSSSSNAIFARTSSASSSAIYGLAENPLSFSGFFQGGLFRVVSQNNQILSFDEDGRFGIGTDSPEARLHVIGNSIFSGNLEMLGNRIVGLGTPIANSDAVNKEYVDSQISNIPPYLAGLGISLIGQTFSVAAGTGLSQNNDGLSLDLGYTDNRYVNRAGDSMSGNLNMGGNRVVGAGNPVGSNDLVTKQYVDDAISAGTFSLEASLGPQYTFYGGCGWAGGVCQCPSGSVMIGTFGWWATYTQVYYTCRNILN